MSALLGQIALITGASSGIGEAIALALAEQGAELALVGRRLDALQAVASRASAGSARLRCYRADLSVDDDVTELSARVQDDFGALDLLVHSAGIIVNGPLERASVLDFDRQYCINVRAPYLLTQAVLPLLKARQGQIVFINSTVGLQATAHAGQYGATKHALRAIADSLRAEINADGVRVLSVFLGRTATPMQAALYQAAGQPYSPELLIQPKDVAQVVLNILQVPRTAEVTDIYLRPMVKSY